jgi:hypothetical protein
MTKLADAADSVKPMSGEVRARILAFEKFGCRLTEAAVPCLDGFDDVDVFLDAAWEAVNELAAFFELKNEHAVFEMSLMELEAVASRGTPLPAGAR